MQRIRRVRVIPLVRRLSRAFHGSTYRIVSRNTLYVCVESEDGIVDEAFGGDEDIHQEKVVELANEIFAPQLVGKEILPIEKLWQSMFTRRGLPFHNRSIHTLDLINHAILMQAIAIIDMGIWDLGSGGENTRKAPLVNARRFSGTDPSDRYRRVSQRNGRHPETQR